MLVHRIAYWSTRRLQRMDLLVSRRVPAHAVTLAAIGVSVLAGLALALGGLLRRPSLWLTLPALVLIRLALGAHLRSRQRRIAAYPLCVEETYVDVPEPTPIEDEMLYAVGR